MKTERDAHTIHHDSGSTFAFIIGGRDVHQKCYKQCLSYDSKNQSYHEYGSLIHARYSPGTMTSDGYLYVFSGMSDDNLTNIDQIERHSKESQTFEPVEIDHQHLLKGMNFASFTYLN